MNLGINKKPLTKTNIKVLELVTTKPKFSCDLCRFASENRKDYKRHLLTKKHKKKTEIVLKKYGSEIITPIQKNNSKYDLVKMNQTTSVCGKKYKYRSGLLAHIKKCKKCPKIRAIMNENDTVNGEDEIDDCDEKKNPQKNPNYKELEKGWRGVRRLPER